MLQNTKEITRKVKSTARGLTFGLTAQNMLGNGLKTRSMEMEFILG